MNKILFKTIPFLLVLFFACSKDKITEPIVIPVTKNYLHLSHTRTNTNPAMDSTVEVLDYSVYDMLWLGGDLAYLTSEDDATMTYVDMIFDIQNPNTLWALGNHDYSDLNRVEQFTNRPPYYTFHKNGITSIVLDTQDSFSSIVGAQQTFINSVLDTLQETSHLVILTHKLIWMYGEPTLEPQIPSVSNGGLGNCFYCINPNNFYTEVYPKLVDIKQQGIEVLCIAGDIGFQATEFEYITADGVHFLASGIKDGAAENKALLFTHDITNKTLDWEYKLLSDL